MVWYVILDISNRLIQGYKLCLSGYRWGWGLMVATAAPDLLIYGQRFVAMTSFLSQRHGHGELGDIFRLLQGFQVPGSGWQGCLLPSRSYGHFSSKYKGCQYSMRIRKSPLPKIPDLIYLCETTEVLCKDRLVHLESFCFLLHGLIVHLCLWLRNVGWKYNNPVWDLKPDP